MAAYNGGPYLRTAVESVLNQTFTDFELLIVDDGSTDGSATVIDEYAGRDPRVRAFHNDGNRGLLYSRMRAFAECRSRLIAIADADDVCRPDRFEKQVAFLGSHPDVGFIGSSVDLINERSEPIGPSDLPESHEQIRFLSLLGASMWDTTTVYRAELLRGVGGYDVDIAGGGLDYDLWTRLMEKTRCHNVPERLVQARIHEKSYTANLSNTRGTQAHVSRRLLSQYLQTEISEEQASDALTLFAHGWRFVMSRGSVESAIASLRHIRQVADSRELPATLHRFRSRAANSFFHQAGMQLTSSRSLSLRLMWEALNWQPAILSPRRIGAYLVRFVVPRGLRRAGRNQ